VVQKLQPPSEASPAGTADGFVLQSEHISMILKAVSDHLKKGATSARQTHRVTSLSPNKEVQAIRCLNIMIELSGHHVREFTPGFLALLTKVGLLSPPTHTPIPPLHTHTHTHTLTDYLITD